jgi:hypothetical protein
MENKHKVSTLSSTRMYVRKIKLNDFKFGLPILLKVNQCSNQMKFMQILTFLP